VLASYSWPGNIRELRNELERAVVLSRTDLLEPENFSNVLRAAVVGAAGEVAGLRSLEEVEREVIAATLEATRYRVGRAAEVLGISRKTLLEKRKKYGLQRPSDPS
jgi:DNA-binding NtrC family response regulator